MRIILYGDPLSNHSTKVEIALRLKGLDFELVPPPGGDGSVEYKAIVPSGTIPAMVEGSLVISDSEVINEYIEEAYIEPRLLPQTLGQRARCRMLAHFHDNRLEPPLRALFAQLGQEARDPATVREGFATFHHRLDDLARAATPRPFLLGEEVTLADIAYPGTLLLAEKMAAALGEPLHLPGELSGWWQRLRRHPEMAPVLDRQAEATDAWLEQMAAASQP